MRKWIALAASTAVACAAVAALSAAPGPAVPPSVRQAEKLAREVLGPNDGWAADGTGTTGGSAATPDHVYVVTNRNELKAALGPLAGDAPRIVIVSGTIRGDEGSGADVCASFATNTGYTRAGYLAAFDPAVWGRTKVPAGPLETARAAAANTQKNYIRFSIPSNTTLVGAGTDARIVGAHVRVAGVNNVIIRNLTIQDAFDCFPQWDPTDGSSGNWNSAYDLISVDTSTHVWIDHCAFNDGDHPDSAQPYYFGRIYQQHDGAVDITKAADLVTLSWNYFTNHDKVMLIGSGDQGSTAKADMGKLRVTIHHNYFGELIQRQPRVRFGKVHVYNNYYLVGDDFSYAWGVGILSQIFAENNFFDVEGKTTPDEFIGYYKYWKNTNPADSRDLGIYVGETLVNGPAIKNHVDVLNEYNAVASASKQLAPTVDWWPTLFDRIDPTPAVPALVKAQAGPFSVNEK